MPNAMLDRLEQERSDVEEFMEKVIAGAQAQERDLSDTEQENLKTSRERIAKLDLQIEPLQDFEKTRSAHRAGGNVRPANGGDQEPTGLGVQTGTRGHIYRSAGEIMADAWRAKNAQDEDSKKRLESIGRGIVNGKLEVTDRAVARGVDEQYVASLTAEQRAAAPHITTVEIPGLMPNTIQGPIVNDIDASRPFLSSIGVKDMSGIPGKTFSRPIVSEHVQMGTQVAEKDELTDGQFKVTDVDFTKSTEGGWANVSRQSIDWSSPAMWDALLGDFQDIYAQHTENKAADAFVVSVQLGTVLATVAATGTNPTIQELITALYGGAVQTYTGSGALPDHVWMSLDMWAQLGITMDTALATTAGQGIGANSLQNLQQGGVLQLPRTVVPSFPTATLIIGRKNRVEAYEDRLGFLSAVEPKLLGVQIAYGGYFASNVLSVPAFVELTFT